MKLGNDEALGFGIIFTVCAIMFSFGLKAINASSRVEFCYVEHTYYTTSDAQYTLRGYVSWRADRVLARGRSFEEVLGYAKKLGCKIR